MTIAAGAGTQPEATQTSAGSPPESSDASAQSGSTSSEARDAATFARYGMQPDGSPLEAKPAEAPSAASADEEDEADPATPDGDSDAATATAAEADEDDADSDEISDEQVGRYVEALLELNPDLVAQNPKIRERVEAEIRAQVEQDYEARQRAATASQERERLTAQGRTAVEAVASALTKAEEGFARANAELAKAEAGQEFNPKVITDGLGFTVENLREQLATYGNAATFDVRRSHEDAFLTAFKGSSEIGGPITPEEVNAIKAIVNTSNRIEGDEAQGTGRFDKAKEHYYGETVKFLTNRAFEAGKVAAIADAKAKRDARKAVLDADAVLAGAAKEAKARGALPPAPTAAAGSADVGAATIDAYKAAKAAGDFALADAIALKMQNSAPPEAQRRLRR